MSSVCEAGDDASPSERIPQWLDAVRQDGLPSLRTLAAGIDRNRDAVITGLSLPQPGTPSDFAADFVVELEGLAQQQIIDVLLQDGSGMATVRVVGADADQWRQEVRQISDSVCCSGPTAVDASLEWCR
ncbi:hypothetical protein AB0I16_17295 [Streptomyces sp. NPDC050703]|uniref:hypothetical protein n=1 Tax=Streptomyces sp. NPDC050703 TaxID=3157218 RepID=UPI003447E159